MKPNFPVRAPPLEPRRICSLLPGIRVRDVADACRSAALTFAAHGPRDWSRRELADWLVGPYAQAVAPTRSLRVSGTRRAVVHRPVDEASVQELLTAARTEVIEVVRAAWSWKHDAASVRASVEEGLVVGVVDAAGAELGYAPVDSARMRLADRVRSLFVADYLTRPTDYAFFAICRECDGPTFDGGLSHLDCTRRPI